VLAVRAQPFDDAGGTLGHRAPTFEIIGGPTAPLLRRDATPGRNCSPEARLRQGGLGRPHRLPVASPMACTQC